MLRFLKPSTRYMTTMTKTPPKDPLIVIVGSTGTGKSKLAVSLATKYNGEIINADAIQMYRGLPIVTNKIPEHERNGIPHHLLDRIGLGDTPWTVYEFIDETSKIIREIRARGKLPIVVGGTNYYVFSLVFEESTLGESGSEDGSEECGPTRVESTTSMCCTESELAILDQPTEVVLAKLRELDPVMASSWHPKDRRKIQRSLEICLKSGRKASEIYEEQKFIKGQIPSQSDVPTLRYSPLVFWLEAEDAVLKDRLNKRVDTMVQDGLLEETKEMWTFARDTAAHGLVLNKKKGIWIAIGYKELEAWLDACESYEGDNTEALVALRDSGIDAIKAATRQYAKRQHRWIRIRLAQHLKAANILDQLFLLDGTNISEWDDMVAIPSESITQAYLSGQQLPENSSLSELASQTFGYMLKQDKISGRQARHCETCQKTLMTEEEWSRHVKSNRHKKIVEGIRRRAQQALTRPETSQLKEVTANV